MKLTMIKFVCLFPLLFYYCCHGYPITGEIPDDTDIAFLIENLINHYNNISSTTDEIPHSLNLSTEIQNAPDILHHLEHLINQSNSTSNHSKALEDLKIILFSKIGVGGGKGGGSTGGGSKGGGSKGGGGTYTRIGGHNYYRRNNGTRSNADELKDFLVLTGMTGCLLLLSFLIFGVVVIVDHCKEKNGESTKT